MTVASVDLCKAINTAWDASTLNDTFKALWDDPLESEFYVLNDQESPAEQPWPYVVMDEPVVQIVERQSGGENKIKRRIEDVIVKFNVHAEYDSGDTKSCKQVASELAEEIMKVFGGHPSTAPTGTITLDNGNHLITKIQSDTGIKTGDDEYQWILEYLFRLDIPEAV